MEAMPSRRDQEEKIYLLYIILKFKDTNDKETILKASKGTRIKWPYISH